jgi:hypothetical protein
MKYVIDDAGRAAHSPGEDRDCTVRALAIAFGVEYGLAHEIMASTGRKPRRSGRSVLGVAEAVRRGLGVAVERPDLTRRRLKSLPALINPEKRYIFRYRGHIFGMVKGYVWDAGMLRQGCIVTHAWEIQPAAERPGRVLRCLGKASA